MDLLHRRRRTASSLVLALTLCAVPTLTTASSADASTPYCSIWWGSLDKPAQPLHGTPTPAAPRSSASPGTNGVHAVTNVRTGRHECFDRLVVDMGAPSGTGYAVRYVDTVLEQGRGEPVPLRGGARLEIVLMAPAYDINTGQSTYLPHDLRELTAVAGFSTFRQVAFGGSFEGYTTIGLGVRARLPMRVFVLDGPAGGSRIVIDVAHRW